MIDFQLKVLFLLLCFFILAGCKKENGIDVKNLYGKWRLTEIYDRYQSGNSPSWQTTGSSEVQVLEFTADRHYSKLLSTSGATCSGIYATTGIQLSIHSDCNPGEEAATISLLNKDTLIIDHQGTEGQIRYKYYRSN